LGKAFSDKSRFLSQYGNGYISGPQYLSELICSRKAKVLKNSDLPAHFHQLDEWKKEFRSQIPSAVKLLKQFSIKAILRALDRWECKKTYSLRSPFLLRYIVEEQGKVIIEDEAKQLAAEQPILDVPPADVNEKPREPFKNKEKGSIWNKLN
jgi:hypothetical protein